MHHDEIGRRVGGDRGAELVVIEELWNEVRMANKIL
jgi:hypothetical protein